MDQNHARAFSYLEQTKETLLANLSASDPLILATRTGEKWSPIEHCYHVYLAEKVSRNYCIKKLSYQPQLQNAGFTNQLRIWAFKVIEWTPIKFKAPKAINDLSFPKNLNLELIRQEWAKDRIELKGFLTTLDPSLVHKKIYKHPFAGRLTIGGMLAFFQFHQDRHWNHIRRDYGIDYSSGTRIN